MTNVNYTKELEELMDIMLEENGSDVHLSVKAHPTIRVTNALIPLLKKPILSNEDADGFVRVLLTGIQYKEFIDTREMDFSYEYKNGVRFRGNAFFQRGGISIALRLIPNKIRTIAELSLPPILESFTQRPQGFFLCVGPVGQGKSTTLAAMIDKLLILNSSKQYTNKAIGIFV